jgi:pyrimidine operon attenuation protein/uracil phosphoribosyltransferase
MRRKRRSRAERPQEASIEIQLSFATHFSLWYDPARLARIQCKGWPHNEKMVRKPEARTVMTAAEVDLALARMAAEIVENLSPRDEFAIIGIRRRGVHLAQRLRGRLEAILDRPVLTGILDITLYRDDLTTVADHPMLRETSIDFDVTNLSLVLVDDVLYTGRTVRAALDGLVDLGRPKRVQLAVLIDRGHRELPIQADYVGKYVQTAEDEIVEVRMNEEDQEERVVLVKRA